MKFGTLAALAATMLTAVTLAAPTPVSAETATVHDEPDNLPVWMDLATLRGVNEEHRARAVLHVEDLQNRGRFELGFTWHEGDTGYGFFVRVRHTASGMKTTFRHEKQGGDSSPRWTCAENHGTFKYEPSADRITLSVPHACLRAYDGIRVINNWGAYGNAYRFVDGDLQFDTLRTGRLRRG
jgi:hypothetical protein